MPQRCTGYLPPRCGRELTGWEYRHPRKRPAPSPGVMKISRCNDNCNKLTDRRYSFLYHPQGLRSSEKEGDLSQQGLEGVQDPELNPLQDCTQRGNRTCSAIQRSGDRLESGETNTVRGERLLSCLQDDLNTALEAIRGGMPVQKAAAEFGKKIFINQHPLR